MIPLPLPLLLLSALAHAHGDHAAAIQSRADDESLSYAERHMAAEHHIESFDEPAFFKLHDLDLDGFWDRDEIAAIYGLRHHSVATPKKKKHDEGFEDRVVSAVLLKLDTDGDGKVSLDEFKTGGMDSLPIIGDFKDLGHHYDEESEYFLHHEELYHSTPETQTDESYNHPEDIAHFRNHEHIEAEEDARERKFEGLAANADLTDEHKAHDPLEEAGHAAGEGPEAYAAAGKGPDVGGGQTWDEQTAEETEGTEGTGTGAQQVLAGQQEGSAKADGYQQARFRDVRAGRKVPPRRLDPDTGHKHRASAEERARADAPYKFKMRGGLRSDEF
ncbi:hypothetical protein CcaverHIS002_0303810 [Cutaneotrichosporon cavernicola]|uniref:EF-hand domain-containing protein n=1 Tax=Cutaneotrichosporon cavernicola TaxID=279322 RepID=A0AA48I311_9TREE|nr:uncharacterized protein CcaverHIS019_0303790 [Cutaneotrichosporon cavernicola]BEI82513.1 hypothetical protein CcaverHIS002_0303810 [Cutaneotrichosporon cavernicola]BEI90309.1 hypothetical protein CcaverHIS019_0303790 [Cutaneotrichosporon cavernicola]BEI98085.1 hypothetical protein CcaverHIS631_0303840 [Cutaneotrichosporon cavernicola]BEJ05862.1 hypothetical protein CcaverHIS641_0303840 [Cutaneotrichosporon cavernicola]